MATSDQEDEKICRYCFEDEEDGPLISPCACSGGQKYVHLACLRRWQRMVLVSQPTHPAFYRDDIRHHECNVCKSYFTCEPPTRLELMETFTGFEIAALIEPHCIIGSNATFDAELESQMEQMPRSQRAVSSYDHWVRGSYLITSVDADDGTHKFPVRELPTLQALRHILLTSNNSGRDNPAMVFDMRGERLQLVGIECPSNINFNVNFNIGTNSDASTATATAATASAEVNPVPASSSTQEAGGSGGSGEGSAGGAQNVQLQLRLQLQHLRALLQRATQVPTTLNFVQIEEDTDGSGGGGGGLLAKRVASSIGNDHVVAVNLTRRFHCSDDDDDDDDDDTRGGDQGDSSSSSSRFSREFGQEHESVVEAAFRHACSRHPSARSCVQLQHFKGGPCDEDEVVCCLVAGGTGKGWTVVQATSAASASTMLPLQGHEILAKAIKLACSRFAATMDPSTSTVGGRNSPRGAAAFDALASSVSPKKKKKKSPNGNEHGNCGGGNDGGGGNGNGNGNGDSPETRRGSGSSGSSKKSKRHPSSSSSPSSSSPSSPLPDQSSSSSSSSSRALLFELSERQQQQQPASKQARTCAADVEVLKEAAAAEAAEGTACNLDAMTITARDDGDDDGDVRNAGASSPLASSAAAQAAAVAAAEGSTISPPSPPAAGGSCGSRGSGSGTETGSPGNGGGGANSGASLFGGAVVRLLGLQSRPDLNGQIGVLLKFNFEAGRWMVRLGDGAGKQVKPMNLETVVFHKNATEASTSTEPSTATAAGTTPTAAAAAAACNDDGGGGEGGGGGGAERRVKTFSLPALSLKGRTSAEAASSLGGRTPAGGVGEAARQQQQPQQQHPRVAVFWGDARWSRAQLLGEIARGHWGLCKASVDDVVCSPPHKRYAKLGGRLAFAPVTEMTEEFMRTSSSQAAMDAYHQNRLAQGHQVGENVHSDEDEDEEGA